MEQEKGCVLIFSAIVGCLGLISAALAFAGEGTKIKSSDVKMVGNVCDYPESAAALNCSFFSWVLLIAVQIIINLFSIYSFCQRHQHNINSKRVNAAGMCLAFSWVTFICAFFMLTEANADSYLRHNPTRYDHCHVLKPGVFSGAGVLVLATVALGITCNFLLIPSDSSTRRPIPRPDPTPDVISDSSRQCPHPCTCMAQSLVSFINKTREWWASIFKDKKKPDILPRNVNILPTGHDMLPSSMASPPNQNVLPIKSNPHCNEILPS